MSKVFEIIDQENKKQIEKIKANISKAEMMIEKLKPSLTYDADIEEYSEVNIKIKSYEDFIRKNKEQIEFITNNPYNAAECNDRRSEIQKEYNLKFKRIYSDIVNQIEKLCNSFDNYEQITNNFIQDRNVLNANAAKANCSSNVYEGEGIKNDYYLDYKNTINDLKNLMNLHTIQ